MDVQAASELKATYSSLFFILAILLLTNINSARANNIGYDENTEIVVRGIIKQCAVRPYMKLQCFTLQTRNRIFKVIVAPQWYLRRIKLELDSGVNVEVVGSKFFGRDGSLCLSARSMKFLSSGRNIVFRDGSCRPVWQNSCLRESSCIRIFYQSP
jgi:hypothetical protein